MKKFLSMFAIFAMFLATGLFSSPNQAIAATAPTCSRVNQTFVSGTGTQTAGYTTTEPIVNPLDSTKYSVPGWTSSSLVTSIPSPWVNPSTDSDFSSTTAKWISTTGNIGVSDSGDGDSWRLFKQDLNIPSTASDGKVAISFTADNAVAVYIDGTLAIPQAPGVVYGAAPINWQPEIFRNVYQIPTSSAEHNVQFVVRNWNFPSANPTGLLYKIELSYQPADLDGDGICDTSDFCPNTQSDLTAGFTDPWGVHRWFWNGTNWFQQPNKNGTGGSKTPFTMSDTSGCSCMQILDVLKEAGLGEFGGHYKFGCSTSILQDFKDDVADGTLHGRYLVDTVKIPANKYTDTLSSIPLASGIQYYFEASGTWTNSLNVADAEFASNNAWSTHFDGYNITPWSLGVNEFDLQINDTFVDWGAYSSAHDYSYAYTGTGSPVGFRIFDGDSNLGPTAINPGWYGDNTGSLTVNIYAQL